ncbi:MAG: universal stress protein [Rhizobiaceae bacterium]
MTTNQRTPDGPVLAAVDFSEDSAVAVEWAARQAELLNVPLVILHVVHDPAASPGFYHKPGEDYLRPMVDVAEDMMEDFLQKVKEKNPDLPALATTSARLVSGLPAGRIAEITDETGASIVVIGSKGRTGLQSILLGSVAERVVQISPVPVVITKNLAMRQRP